MTDDSSVEPDPEPVEPPQGRAEDEAEFSYVTYQYVHVDSVAGEEVNFGNTSHGRRRPGRIGSGGLSLYDTVDPGDRRVFATRDLERASARLERDHLVLLIGPEGTGKAFGALCVLGEHHQEQSGKPKPAFGLSPILDADEIAAKVQHKKALYFIDGSLLLTRTAEHRDRLQLEHGLASIASTLRSNGSYMAISVHADAESAERQRYGLDWTMPDPGDLLRHLVIAGSASGAVPIDGWDDDLDRLVAPLSERRPLTPTLVASMAQMLCRSMTPDAARSSILKQAGNADVIEMTDWLKSVPELDLVLFVVVLAFLGGLDELTVEREYAELLRLFAAQQSGEAVEKPQDQKLQDRQARLGLPFVQVGGASRMLLPDRSVNLRTDTHHRAAMDEIWSRYGPGFWKAVCDWIDGLPDRVPDQGVDKLAQGLAGLATCSFSVVWQTLDRWWGGHARQRRCAVNTVSALAFDDRLAPAALACCLMASRHGTHDPLRAWSTDMALGGPLGAAFPGECIPRLWERMKSQPAGGTAGLALWQHLAGQLADEELWAVILRYFRLDILEPERQAEKSARLGTLMQVLGARFSLDVHVAQAPLRMAQRDDAQRILAVLLRAAIWDRATRTQAIRLVSALIRQSRVEHLQRRARALLIEVAASPTPRVRRWVQAELSRLLASAYRNDDPVDDDDDALMNTFRTTDDGGEAE